MQTVKPRKQTTREMLASAEAYTLQKQAMKDKDTVVIIGDASRDMRHLTKTFNLFDVKFVQVGSKRRCRDIIVDMVSASPDGFTSVVSHNSPLYATFMDYIEDATFNEAIDFIMQYPRVLCSCIAYNGNKFVTGYRMEDLSVFFPKAYRDIRRTACREEMAQRAMSHMSDVYADDFENELVDVDNYLED